MGTTLPPRPLNPGPSPLPPLPPGQWGLSQPDKGKSLKGENYISTGEGGGAGVGVGRGRGYCGCRNRLVCIYSCLTQHKLIFHIKDQIIFQLQLITHPKSTSKDGPRPPSPCFAVLHAPRFHAWLLSVCGPAAPAFTPTENLRLGPKAQGASWALRPLLGLPGHSPSPLDALSPHQNSSPGVSFQPTSSPEGNLSPAGRKGRKVGTIIPFVIWGN